MNMTFKLGKVMVPVPALKDGIIIEGLEVSVSDYNLMEGLKVLKELPSIMFELRQVMEVDLDDMPSAMEEEELKDDEVPDFIKHLIAKTGAIPINHPVHGKGFAVPKEHPLAGLGKEMKNPLESLFGQAPKEGKMSLGDLLDKMKKDVEDKLGKMDK